MFIIVKERREKDDFVDYINVCKNILLIFNLKHSNEKEI